MTLNDKGGALTRVGSNHVVSRANELQDEIGEGPCLSMRRDQDTIVIQDLAGDHRWPCWGARVHSELGVGSMMSLLVYTDHQSYGALSLYGSRGRPFGHDDAAIAQALAGHLATIIASGREIDHLEMAKENRLTIGQAQGILMERLDLDADQAFDYLRRVSSHSNRKLVDIADELLRTRRLPDRPIDRSSAHPSR
jgi:GAF domain-containing protein